MKKLLSTAALLGIFSMPLAGCWLATGAGDAKGGYVAFEAQARLSMTS